MSFEAVDKLYDDHQYEEGLEQLKKRLNEGEKTCEVLWRMCRFCHEGSSSLKGKLRDKIIEEGCDYGNQAVLLDPSNFHALKWSAILFGLAVDNMSTKEKIKQGGVLKDMLDRALEVEPNDFALLHLRGRFLFTLATLSWAERKLASIIYDELPDVTIDEALADFELAFKTQPEWIENNLYLGKCYLTKKEKGKAKDCLSKAANLSPLTPNDKDMLKEIKKMLSSC